MWINRPPNYIHRNMSAVQNVIKKIVSQKRNRYIEDGYNLDLTYITDHIIAMGFPAKKIESLYRNHIDTVSQLLDDCHLNHYKVYNLCAERSYDKSKFHDNVDDFPFEDHNPPEFEMIISFCEAMQIWLMSDPHNVSVIHCKAGKGRTGTMICCYLLHSQQCSTAEEALILYGTKRTTNNKGVTIPSQIRYVHYYEQYLNNAEEYGKTSLQIKTIVFDPAPMFSDTSSLSFKVSGPQMFAYYKSASHPLSNCEESSSFSIELDECISVSGDVEIRFYRQGRTVKSKFFSLWFNTYFAALSEPTNETIELVFSKRELDKMMKKDKNHKNFRDNFKLKILLTMHVLSRRIGCTRSSRNSIFGDTSSDSSDDDDSISLCGGS